MAATKRQTTMAKVMREQALREKRSLKKEKKDAKKLAAATEPPVALSDEGEPG